MSNFLESWEEKNRRIVVFAGVFDPVHKGHISAAEQALHFGSKVVFLAERTPQHKHGTTAYEHRLNMLRIATNNNPQFEVVDYPNENHWIAETFLWFKERYPDSTFVWLVGNDVAPLIEKWPDSERLAEFGVKNILAARRAGHTLSLDKTVHETKILHIVRARKKHEKLNSTMIREDIAHNHTALPKAVWEYVQQHKLYDD
jgi:nicotinate-nucleotide adenylyltransferase